jgi:hypothetical protein
MSTDVSEVRAASIIRTMILIAERELLADSFRTLL